MASDRQIMLLELEYILFFVFSITAVSGGKYCWYTHEDHLIVRTTYCEAECCNDFGEEDDICCFSWTIGVILGITIGTFVLITGIATLVICCVMASKKRCRIGSVVNPVGHHQTSSAILYPGGTSGIHSYSYPHPPSAFYPSSHYPHAPNIEPTYSTLQQGPNHPPPSYSAASGMATESGHHDDVTNQYGGYGKGNKV